MILYTSATEKLRITSGGNIGIDCTPNDHNSFTRALDINGPSGAAVYMRTNDNLQIVLLLVTMVLRHILIMLLMVI